MNPASAAGRVGLSGATSFSANKDSRGHEAQLRHDHITMSCILRRLSIPNSAQESASSESPHGAVDFRSACCSIATVVARHKNAF